MGIDLQVASGLTQYNLSSSAYPFVHNMTYHAFWNGQLNEKHLLSILSCYMFNVRNNVAQRKIIVWTENVSVVSSSYFWEDLIVAHGIAEARHFWIPEAMELDVVKRMPVQDQKALHSRMKGKEHELSFLTDSFRYLLLLEYGGVWFDLDVLFLRPFDILTTAYPRTWAYRWESQPYPNNALYFSPGPQDFDLRAVFEYLLHRGRGFGFQEANLRYDSPVPLLILPCAWFDGAWIKNSFFEGFQPFFEESHAKHTLASFFRGAFAYHWHNRWLVEPHPTSPFAQLLREVRQCLGV